MTSFLPRLWQPKQERTTRPTRPVWLYPSAITLVLSALILGAYGGSWAQESPSQTQAALVFDRPTYSSPIALDANKNLLWVVSPDDDKVVVIGNLDSTPTVLRKISVGDEPQSVAIDTGATNGTSYHVYVANAADNNVTVLTVDNSSASSVSVSAQKTKLTTGSEPWNIVASPDGKRIFVANSGQDTISVIRADTNPPSLVGAVDLRSSICNDPDRTRHFQPHGMAVTLDSSRLLVTRFLSFVKSGGVQATDTGKEGLVCQLTIPADVATLPTVSKAIPLASMVTGFKIPNNPADTSAYPNQLHSIVIRGNQAYVPNIAASTTGPLRFNTDTHAFVNVIDDVAGNTVDAPTKSINMHLGARIPETGKKKLFFANPWGIAFTNESGAGNAYAVSSGSDLLVKLNVDANGALAFTGGISTTRYIDLNDTANANAKGDKAGKNPIGLVIRGTKAFVANFVSRNVSIVDLTTDSVTGAVRTASLPRRGSQDEQLLVGAEIFFSSRGVFDGGKEDRLSSEGWQNCASCHFVGLTDGNVWSFNAGPRKSVPLNGTWSPHNPDDQRMLNYSAIFDEVQDFELNIRNVSGPGPLSAQGKAPVPCAFLPAPAPANTISVTAVFDPNQGLALGDDNGVTASPCTVVAFNKPNSGRPQLTVTLPGSNKAWPALDSMKEWVRFAVRTPNGMLTEASLPVNQGGLAATDVIAGRKLFFKAQCQECHGGTKWTTSNKDFVSPPASSTITTEVGAAGTVQAQFFPASLSDIASFALGTAANPIGGNVGAEEKSQDNLNALGKDHNGDGVGNGFNIPSLLGIWQLPPYYHNGACESLACVLGNQKHRTGNGKFPDVLGNATDQAKVIAWLQTLDADTNFPTDLRLYYHDIFVDPPTLIVGAPSKVGVNLSLFGTKADLADVLPASGTIPVKFEVTSGNASVSPATVEVPVSAFNQNFGQAVVTTTLTTNAAGKITIKVTVDPGKVIPEAKEGNNSDSRRFKVKANTLVDLTAADVDVTLADITPPSNPEVRLSDDTPFNPDDVLTLSPNLKVRIVSQDEAGGSGLGEYCIVTYFYDKVDRRWVEQECQFAALPAADASNANTYFVDAQIPPRAGVAYAFVWLRDKAGNIALRPGFDVINFGALGTPVTLQRNDAILFRAPALPQQWTVALEGGDVEVLVFSDFTTPGSALCAQGSKNDDGNVVLVLPGSCPAAANVQIEIRAKVTSILNVSIGAPTDVDSSIVASNLASPEAILADDETLVGGPPARLTGIDEPADDAINIYLPTALR